MGFTQIISLVKYILIGLVFGAIVFLYVKWKHSEESAQFWKSTHESNVSYANNKQFKASIDSFHIPVKDRNITEVNHVTTSTVNHIYTVLRDSLTRDSVRLHCINWSSRWSSLNGCIETGLTDIHKDTLDIALTTIPTKKFLFIKFAKKDSIQIFNKDPASHYNIRSFKRIK